MKKVAETENANKPPRVSVSHSGFIEFNLSVERNPVIPEFLSSLYIIRYAYSNIRDSFVSHPGHDYRVTRI